MKKKAPPAAREDVEDDGLPDFTDLKVVREALSEAFANYKGPSPIDHIVPKPGQKHPRDRRNRDGSTKKSSLEQYGKFSVEVAMRILGGLSIGMYYTEACKTSGITHKTGCEWLAHGRRKDEPVGSPYWVYAYALTCISSAVHGRVIKKIYGALANSHGPAAAQAWMNWAKMRFQHYYCDKSKIDLTSNGQTLVGGVRALQEIRVVYVDSPALRQATVEGHSVIEHTEAKKAADDDDEAQTQALIDELN